MFKKESIGILIVSLLAIGGFSWSFFKDSNEKTSSIPRECQQYQGKACDLFDCLVDRCWCKELGDPNPIYKGESAISNKQEAMDAVEKYLLEINSDYKVVDVAEINEFFFNVFAYNSEDDQEVFTIGIDGSILLVVCGA